MLPTRPSLGGPASILPLLAQCMGSLPGFFIAALAAVATFGRDDMDKTMPEPAPTVEMRFGAQRDIVKLTRRVFLSYLFSYLTVLSLLTTFFCIFGYMAGTSFAMSGVGNSMLAGLTRVIFVFVLYAALSSMFIVTLLGVYFLTERMHQPAD